MRITEKIANILKRKYDYTITKCLFNALYMSGGSDCFNANWLKMHMPLVKEIFLKTPDVNILCNYGKARHDYTSVSIEDMVLEEGNLIVKIKNKDKSRVSFEFEKPSEGCIKIEKGVGNRYAMYLFSRENCPSQIIFSYFNL